MGDVERIRALERNLSAEIVIQEEISHEEVTQETVSYSTAGSPGSSSYTDVDPSSWSQGSDSYEVRNKIIDKPLITEPDFQKREAARAELQQIKRGLQETYSQLKWYQFFVKRRIQKTLDSFPSGI